MEQLQPTFRTTLNRLPRRGVFERNAIYAILDEAFACHVGFVSDGHPCVIPTAYGRDGETLFIHGSAASRMQRNLSGGIPLCVTVTLVDGLVLARSAFHHSINYRSVVIFGVATVVLDPEAKSRALRILTEHIAPGRWSDVREPNEQELRATTVLAIPLNEASAKVRAGGPIDDESDFAIPAWAGELPLYVAAGAPIPDNKTHGEPPPYIQSYRRGDRIL